jgi:hypothetical protein
LNNIQRSINRAKLLWVVLGIGVIFYSIFILVNSSSLTYQANPTDGSKIIYVTQRIFAGILFFLAVIVILKLPQNEKWLAWIIFTGLAARIILLPTSTVLEDDWYRYLWDGAVTAKGYNPYAYSPADVMEKKSTVPDELINLSNESGEIIKNINHPIVRTIYPPVVQIFFTTSYIIAPWKLLGWKLILLIGDLILLFFTIKILQNLKLPLTFAAIYWLNPIVLHEFFNAAHMDLFVLLFVMMSVYFFLKDKTIISTILLALAVGIKLWPLIIIPFILRKIWKDKKQIVTHLLLFGILIAVIFIPVFLAGLDDSLGFIKYAARWENNSVFYESLKIFLNSVNDFFGLGISCTTCITRWIVGLIIISLIIFLLRKQIINNFDFLDKIFLALAVLFLISPTQFPWYYTWIVPFLVVRPRLSFLLYPILLPLYQLNYLSGYLVYVQHVPIIILFLYEIKKGTEFNFFKLPPIPKKI